MAIAAPPKHNSSNMILQRPFQTTPCPFALAIKKDISDEKYESFYLRYELRSIFYVIS